MHGAQGGGKTVVDIAATERIVEINGIWGLSSPSTNWGVQMQLLRFTIFDSVTQFYRTTNAFGTPSAKDFVQETRKDICVRGPFVGVSGTADNNLKQVGLDTTVFYTQCPTI
ncbi:hypothetical protein RhiJN_02467 [Ceratobasidium sp. AG-Ba]|nr:hypothetical protein RhiJN_02467 [Ceratobasidium sp. AG-Ba]QRW03397.1 hypothetical protein RhiLY_02396 [Ceratobasidium sp. AG-Ba]